MYERGRTGVRIPATPLAVNRGWCYTGLMSNLRFRIQSTNLYTFNRQPRETLRNSFKHSSIGLPDSVGLQEAGRSLNRGLKHFRGYKTNWKRSSNHHKRDNVLLMRNTKNHTKLGQRWFHAADDAGTKWTPPRNVFVLFYEKKGVKVAHITSHFHVVPEEKLADMPESNYGKAAREYVNHVRLVWRLMNQYKREGYVVFVTADGNTRPRDGHMDWKYAAYRFLDRKKWVATRRGVDLIIHDSELVKRIGFDVVGKQYLGQADHPTLIGEYELRA